MQYALTAVGVATVAEVVVGTVVVVVAVVVEVTVAEKHAQATLRQYLTFHETATDTYPHALSVQLIIIIIRQFIRRRSMPESLQKRLVHCQRWS